MTFEFTEVTYTETERGVACHGAVLLNGGPVGRFRQEPFGPILVTFDYPLMRAAWDMARGKISSPDFGELLLRRAEGQKKPALDQFAARWL